MQQKQIKISFQPSGRTVYVLAGTKIIEATAQAGLMINTPCGGIGSCGKCRVRLINDISKASDDEKKIFTAAEIKDGWRLACKTSINTDSVIEIPESSLFANQHKIVVDSNLKHSSAIVPSIRKIYVELPVPSMEDNEADLLRLERVVGKFKMDLRHVQEIPNILHKCAYKGTAVLMNSRLIGFEHGKTDNHSYGVAFDIGTTTIVGSLVNLIDGKELAVNSQMNPQISFGDDVVSRIMHASSCADCLYQLHSSIRNTVNEMIEVLCKDADVDYQYIYEVVVAGNTTMEHLLCGINPSSLGEIPFVSAFGRGLLLDAKDIGISINPYGKIYVLPIIGGFVGGDTVAGILLTNLLTETGISLMIDVGTNGEIVLAKDGKLLAASTAAGPAFEGARIRYGMRATAGAIEKVVFSEDIQCNVIGNVTPTGICGSGLIDLVAEMLTAGIVTSTGQLLPPELLPQTLSPGLSQRVYRGNDGAIEFLVAEPSCGRKDIRVVLTQRDIREFQLAVGAIRAGVYVMLEKSDITVDDIDQVLIAGGFGSFIRRANAQRIGLLPPEIDHKKIKYIGNASLGGAKWVLLSLAARKQAELIARSTKHLELSLASDFQTKFSEAMMFP